MTIKLRNHEFYLYELQFFYLIIISYFFNLLFICLSVLVSDCRSVWLTIYLNDLTFPLNFFFFCYFSEAIVELDKYIRKGVEKANSQAVSNAAKVHTFTWKEYKKINSAERGCRYYIYTVLEISLTNLPTQFLGQFKRPCLIFR